MIFKSLINFSPYHHNIYHFIKISPNLTQIFDIIFLVIIGAKMQQDQQHEHISVQQQNPIEIQQENQAEEIDIEQDKSQFSDDFQSDHENPPEINPNENNQAMKQIANIPKVTCPISAYSVFMKDWRQKHVGEKVSMSAIGELWKELDHDEKQIYEKKFKEQKQKYEEYQAMMLAIDPNFGKKNKNPSKSYFFPLHRVKAIMKQDTGFTTNTENISAMSKAAEYFGEYLLEQIKKGSEAKKRLDVTNLFEVINTNQNNLWFLNCLIDQHNLQDSKAHTHPVQHQQNQHQPSHQLPVIHEQNKIKKAQKQTHPKPHTQPTQKSKSKKQLPKGQLKLTDMF